VTGMRAKAMCADMPSILEGKGRSDFQTHTSHLAGDSL
jgi:hypothetical protein